jgi:hypothetical protein
MTPRCKLSAAAVLLTAFAATAAADVPPPPGQRERALAAIITAAGHTCDGSLKYFDADVDAERPYRDRGFVFVYRVECASGGRYLVALPNGVFSALPPRRDANGNPIKPPPPEVKPLGP